MNEILKDYLIEGEELKYSKLIYDFTNEDPEKRSSYDKEIDAKIFIIINSKTIRQYFILLYKDIEDKEYKIKRFNMRHPEYLFDDGLKLSREIFDRVHKFLGYYDGSNGWTYIAENINELSAEYKKSHNNFEYDYFTLELDSMYIPYYSKEYMENKNYIFYTYHYGTGDDNCFCELYKDKLMICFRFNKYQKIEEQCFMVRPISENSEDLRDVYLYINKADYLNDFNNCILNDNEIDILMEFLIDDDGYKKLIDAFNEDYLYDKELLQLSNVTHQLSPDNMPDYTKLKNYKSGKSRAPLAMMIDGEFQFRFEFNYFKDIKSLHKGNSVIRIIHNYNDIINTEDQYMTILVKDDISNLFMISRIKLYSPEYLQYGKNVRLNDTELDLLLDYLENQNGYNEIIDSINEEIEYQNNGCSKLKKIVMPNYRILKGENKL